MRFVDAGPMSPSSTATEVATKHCNRCSTTKPVDEFNFKNRARGLRQAHCRACMSDTSRRHYEANKADRVKKIAERNKRVIAELNNLVAAARADAVCADCGAAGTSRALQFTAPHGGTRVTDAVRGAYSRQSVLAAIEASTPLCAPCVIERRYAGQRADAEALAAGPDSTMFVVDAALAAVNGAGGPVTVEVVHDVLRRAGRDDDRKVVASTLSKLARTGKVGRDARGVYIALS